MDKLTQYKQVLQKLINHHAQYKPSHGEINSLAVCDLQTDNYLLIDIGWDKNRRVHDIILHLRIDQGKIWIEWDGIEDGIIQQLLEYGVSQEDIVIGFYDDKPKKLVNL